jgi:O-acetyl-ADP-ribose deacetylase (regulator of RNase III)/tRNA A-37 threonylcarbamoyl transferase component Bud32
LKLLYPAKLIATVNGLMNYYFQQVTTASSFHILCQNTNQRMIGERSPLTWVNLMLRKRLVGRYQIISHLGGGGFGTTFVAEDRHLPGNPRCVVKQLKLKTTAEPTVFQAVRRLFNTEAEVLYQLGNHDQIPRLFAHFEEDEEFYLVQEFIEGRELRQELPLGQQLSETESIRLVQEILEILTFVHQQNVIHRDIKPANLIRRKQDGKLVMIDFGAVKQISTQVMNSQGQTSLTVAIGSPGYMPAEQQAGKPRFCSDIYAVGMIGIQALTGLHPTQLPEDSNSEIIWRDRLKVSPELGDILDKMVRYDFRQRYQSTAEVLKSLNSLGSRPFTANSQSFIKSRIAVVEGDITKQQVDAIINPTDVWFSGGGAVDRTIQRAAGPKLKEECHQLRSGWTTGEAKITNGYNLPARWVIHTVGPSWNGGYDQEDQKLAQCYRNCLALAEQYSIRTIAFPAISTGGNGFRIELATRIAVTEVKSFLERHTSPEKVIFVCFGKGAYDCYLNTIKEIIE